jgi:DNA-binding transcriptional LysR family regulator
MQLRPLQEDRLNLALIMGWVTDDGISIEALWSERLIAALPRGHPFRKHSRAGIGTRG